MIGKLKKVEVKTVYEEKVLRLRIDIPYRKVKGIDIKDEDFKQWLMNKVDGHIGITFNALDEEATTLFEDE